MEPIPVLYDTIDRHAILVRPRQPFLDRATGLFNDGTTVTGKEECNIYLIREMDSNEDVLKWVRSTSMNCS